MLNLYEFVICASSIRWYMVGKNASPANKFCMSECGMRNTCSTFFKIVNICTSTKTKMVACHPYLSNRNPLIGFWPSWNSLSRSLATSLTPCRGRCAQKGKMCPPRGRRVHEGEDVPKKNRSMNGRVPFTSVAVRTWYMVSTLLSRGHLRKL